MKDGVKEDVAEVRQSYLVLEDVCWLFEKESRQKRCCESARTKRYKPAERTRWLERHAWRSRHCSVEDIAFLNEDLEKAGQVKT